MNPYRYNTFYFKLAALITSSITAALAGMMHTLHQPIVSPNVASLTFTVEALLIVLIGGMGTLSGALVGAAVLRLLAYFLDEQVGESADFILRAVYVALVIFVPYGIVGTWKLRSFQIKQGRDHLARLLSGEGKSRSVESVE